MKHPAKLTTILILFFLVSQVLGLYIISQNIDFKKSAETGKPEFVALPGGAERPEVDERVSWVYILVGILIGTVILLVLIKFKLIFLWKFWFFLSVVTCLTIALATFMSSLLAFLISLILAYFKIVKPNTYVHNISELFVYAGLAVVFVPILNRLSVIILLILISIYDMYAVWKSKHMVKMANFQTESKIFAGFFVPYNTKDEKIVGLKQVKVAKEIKGRKGKIDNEGIHQAKSRSQLTMKSDVRSAILGGGDVAFPMLFAGVMMKYAVVTDFWMSFLKIMIIPAFATIALALLFYKTEKGRFYPAMPFITVGCLVGYGIYLIV